MANFARPLSPGCLPSAKHFFVCLRRLDLDHGLRKCSQFDVVHRLFPTCTFCGSFAAARLSYRTTKTRQSQVVLQQLCDHFIFICVHAEHRRSVREVLARTTPSGVFWHDDPERCFLARRLRAVLLHPERWTPRRVGRPRDVSPRDVFCQVRQLHVVNQQPFSTCSYTYPVLLPFPGFGRISSLSISCVAESAPRAVLLHHERWRTPRRVTPRRG